MLKRIGSWCWSVAKKILSYSAHRAWECVRYCAGVVKDTSINALIMIPICTAVWWILMHLGFNMTYIDVKQVPPPVWYLALVFLRVGVFEEGVFRYLIQDCMFGRWLEISWRYCWIFASILFGCAHFLNPGTFVQCLPQVLGAIGAGLWFGWVYRKRGLSRAILCHALYDFALTIISLS